MLKFGTNNPGPLPGRRREVFPPFRKQSSRENPLVTRLSPHLFFEYSKDWNKRKLQDVTLKPMNLFRPVHTFLIFCALCATSVSAFLGSSDQVTVKLVSDRSAIAPGKPFKVGLQMAHQPHWHTYWRSTATGYATSLKWALPNGFEAGEIEWPIPETYEMEGFIEYVYEDTVLLPVTITPPENLQPGSAVHLKATAKWLMCAEVCIPGKSEVSIELPVAAEARSNPEWDQAFNVAAAHAPLKPEGIELKAWRENEAIFLAVNSANGAAGEELYFFDADRLIEPTPSQKQSENPSGWKVIELKQDPGGTGDPNKLFGALRTTGSWTGNGQKPALEVDIPIAESPPDIASIPATTSDSETEDAATGLLATLALAFGGGLILNLMPCVFPVIGIKIMGFVGQAGEDKRRVVIHGIVFTAGVLLSFWILSGALMILRAGGERLGWGFQLQNPIFVFLLGAFLFVFALNLSGLFEVGTSAMGMGNELTRKKGYIGSFFSGVLATVVATPCAAPMLAPALGAALAAPPIESFLLFNAVGLGLSLPYLLLSAFPGLIKMLPKPGAWMESFKQLMAFLLYGTVGYLLWVLVGQLTESGGYTPNALLQVFLGLVLLAVAAWTYGRWAALHMPRKTRNVAKAATLILAISGLAYGWPNPVLKSAEGNAPQVAWQKWEPGKAEALAKEGHIVYVDFTARWCVTCQTNKLAVFSSEEVRSFFAENEVIALKADWTNQDPEISDALESFGRSAVPFNLIYAPTQSQPHILPEFLTPGIVINALEAATSQSGS